MKIAIHHRPGSFSDRWIEYCKENKVDYKLVNAYASDIMQQVNDCDAFMWHHHHANYKDTLFAKQLLYSLQLAGKKVFPDFATGWHFDDKVGQKYLFEAIGAPLVPSYAFYTKKEALEWISSTTFPKVFKLRRGAGASNVKLIRTRKDAVRLVNKAFGKGFPQFDKWGNLKERFHKWRTGKDSFVGVLKGIARIMITTEYSKFHAPEKGYVYFQDFIPNNDTDTRIVVIGDKIIGERRGVRKGDFRASGSHILLPDYKSVDIRCVNLAYEISKKINLQIGVFDFIHNDKNKPLVVEVSYGTDPDYTECQGYWNPKMEFTQCKIDLPYLIIANFLKTVRF